MQVPEAAPSPATGTTSKQVAKLGTAASLLGLVAVSFLVALNARWPSALLVDAAVFFIAVSLLAGVAALLAWTRHVLVSRPGLRWAVLLLVLVSVVTFGAHLYVINSPPTSQCTNSTKLGCIMDEVFYVPAAQAILSGEQCAPYADNCNLEHPFLAKALIASGMVIFGSNDLGWRVFNALLGTLCIPLLFVLVYELSGSKRLSCYSAALLGLDTMFFVHSSAAVIDVPSIFFTLLAFVIYFSRARLWHVDSVLGSGLVLGLALLSKETAIFAVAVLFTYQLVFAGGTRKRAFIDASKLVGATALVFFLGLQVYDTLFTYATVPTFLQQIAFVFKYGSGLTGAGWYQAVLGGYITPLNWLTYYAPVSYLVTTITTTVGSGPLSTTYSYIGVGYYGVNNVIILWVVFVWVPLAFYRVLRQRPEGETVSREDRSALFLLLWLFWSYLPYIALWLYGRVTYPFYILPAVPALSAGSAYFVTRDWFPRWLVAVYVAAAFIWFLIYFPVKDFLPVFLRVWLGR